MSQPTDRRGGRRAAGLTCLLATWALTAAAAAPSPPATTPAAPAPRPAAGYDALPLYFTADPQSAGGADRFTARVPGAAVGLAADGVTFRLRRAGAPTDHSAAGRRGAAAAAPAAELTLRTTLVGADPGVVPVGEQRAPHATAFYLGNDPARWRTNVPSFEAVRYPGVYPGIDLVYHGRGRRLEYDFELAPGADPHIIRLRYAGARRLALDAAGDLVIHTDLGTLTERAPEAWQEKDGTRRPVEVRYDLGAENSLGFRVVGLLDPEAPLVIDPVLDYGTFLGGNAYEEARDIAYDAAGGAWVVGTTYSPNFPASGTPVPGLHRVAFVSRLAPNGQSLVYSVFLGGSEDQVAVSVAVDAAGNAYVSGDTGSNDFPTTPGAYDLGYNGANATADDIFVSKLSPAGALVYSTYLGGVSQEELARLALDSANNVYVFGDSKSTNFPTTVNCYDTSFNGQSDFFLSKLVLAGGGAADLLYSTYLGGNDFEDAHGDLVVDAAGDAYLDAATLSSNFPAAGGPPYNGTFDAVVAKIRPAGAGAADLLWATKLGGVGSDYAFGLAVDPGLSVYVDGYTDSPNFPTTGGVVQPVIGGGADGFVTHLAANGTTILYSTFLGGSGTDECTELGFDTAGRPVVTGDTDSPDFPVLGGSYDTSFNGGSDAFITTLAAGGASLVQSTYFGGSGNDRPWGFKIDALDRWYLCGTTASADFPVTNGAYDMGFNGGGQDGFVARFAPQAPDLCEECDSPADTCCARPPHYQGVEAPTFSPHILVGTRQPDPGNGGPYCVTIFDLGSPTPTEDVNWASVLRFNGPFGSWNSDSLGSVFGLTLDDQGDIFVAHASCYLGDLTGQVAGGGPGAIYRIDATTAAINTFCRLPNYPDPSMTAGEDLPGLGNITWDCRHRQLFATDLEDGRIYRIKPVGTTGVIQETFDPGVQDTGPTNYLTPVGLVPSPGWAPRGERLWGVQWHMDRVYYSVWTEDLDVNSPSLFNEIRSVGLDGAGAFVPSSDRHELFVPDDSLYTYSFPVADISFNAAGNMLLGERGIAGNSYPVPHNSRALQYQCVAGCWQPLGLFKIGDYDRRENGAGGVDYDNFPYTGGPLGRVWASGDALHLTTNGNNNYPDAIYGYQGFRPTGGQNQTSILIDSDGGVITYDKSFIGDVEAPGCPNGDTGQVCGTKYRDLNRNGVRDGGEPGLPGWTFVLNGPGGPWTVTTDEQGNYCFTGLLPGSYTLGEVGQPGWIQTAPAGGSYAITLAAGQTLNGRDFGNALCGYAPPCVTPPPGMGAWWGFDDAPGVPPLAADLAHLAPARNALQLLGGATLSSAGRVGGALHLGAAGDGARLPNPGQAGLDVGAGSFALDTWLNVAASPAGPRVIAEKRELISTSPYRTRGWALYLDGQQCLLELGTPELTETFAGPVLPADQWTHLAVSVDRAAGTGTWYVDGVPNGAFAFSPPAGSLWSNADLYVGRRNPAFGAGVPFDGWLDELEFFHSPLSAQSVAAIVAAGGGKCKEYCRVPSITSICKDKATVTVCMNIVNNTNAPQSYHWSMAGLPAGPGCTVNGPITFSPAAGTVTVPAGATSAPICVTITRPAGLTAQNATACFAFTFLNDQTGVCRSCTGTLRADNSCWCVTPAQAGVVGVGQRFAPGLVGVPVIIGIKHPCDPLDIITYRVTAQYEGAEHPDPHAVSLNGLPPGEPVLGQLAVDANGEADLATYVTFPAGYEPAGLYQVVLEADTDGDGLLETVSCTPIASLDDAEAVAGVPIEPLTPEALRLVTMPNPFRGGATVAFTLPVAAQVQLSIYDLGGRLVRSLAAGRRAAGTQNIAWDGRNDDGRATAGGIYFVRLRAGDTRVQTKVVKLR